MAYITLLLRFDTLGCGDNGMQSGWLQVSKEKASVPNLELCSPLLLCRQSLAELQQLCHSRALFADNFYPCQSLSLFIPPYPRGFDFLVALLTRS